MSNEDLQQKLAELNSKLTHAPESENMLSLEMGRESAVGAGRMGMELAVGLLAGLGLGYGLDRWLGTVPLLMIVCAMLGFAGGAYNAWRAVKGMDETVGVPSSKPKN